ncbi:MarR family winged helix-turn-helix transcriptional regulator [Aeromicrobium sp. UC242_57]|uniref:MarR family winged helix-turn-helix transcriptional regulator n=1 Tax=Aeromicrobium sp. UC242_57 TaxID=3374624 RepID=UPI0037A4FFE0
MSTSAAELFDALDDFIVRVMHLAEVEGMEALVELDLSFSQVRLLFMLATASDPMSIHSIASGLTLSDAAAGRNVEQMLKLDLVERRECSTDRRVKLVSLTPSGEAVVDAHLVAKRASIKTFAEALPQHQRDNLHRALTDVLAGDVLAPRKNTGEPS